MKRLFKRLGLRIYRMINGGMGRRDLTENQIKAAAICRKLINNPFSKFLIAPVSRNRYIRNEKLKMFIILSDNKLKIINHVYSYDVYITNSEHDRLKIMFDNKVESHRMSFENDINSQIQYSLTNIIKKLS
jgi:hypothetical protein